MIWIGVDPGASGGIAGIREVDGVLVYCATPMPKTEADIGEAILDYKNQNPASVYAVIEKVHAFPGQGVASTFKFGMSYGGLRMALVALRIPFETVSPTKWQRALGIRAIKGESKTDHKNRTKALAQEMFPNLGEYRERITHAKADALLLAEYCRRIRT